jgi:hypothetical protein
VVHKLLEEVLTGESPNQAEALEIRARILLAQLGVTEAAGPEEGPHAPELAATTLRALKIPEIAACRARLVPEITVFSARADHDSTTYVGGVADAIAYQPIGLIDLVVDWKTDINPGAQHIELYLRAAARLSRRYGRSGGPSCIRDHGSNRPGTAAPRNAFCRG